MMANYNLGENNMEQSTPSPKLRKKSSGPSQTIVWKTRGRVCGRGQRLNFAIVYYRRNCLKSSNTV